MTPLDRVAAAFLALALPAAGQVAIERPEPAERRDQGPYETVLEDALPLTQPVSTYEVAKLPNGDLVVLAGGVREDLTILRYQPTTGDVQQFETNGGRRLGAAFASGRGSWPLVMGPNVMLFAYERDGQLEFRALGRGRSFASRTLPLSVDDFSVRYEAATAQVYVTFPGDTRSLNFLHPDAPVLERPARLVFGERTSLGLKLRNAGRMVLSAEVVVEGAEFSIPYRCERLALDAGEEVLIPVSCGPRAREGRIVIRSPIASVATAIPLDGPLKGTPVEDETPSMRTAKPVDATATKPAAAADASGPGGAGSRAPAVEAAVEAPVEVPAPAPRLTKLDLEWTDGGRIDLFGAAPFEARLNDGSYRSASRQGERFRLNVAAQAFDRIEARSIETPAIRLERVVPMRASVREEHLELRVRPKAEVLVVGVGGSDSRRVLGKVAAHADETGLVMIPLARIGAAACYVVTLDPDGKLIRRRVTIG